MRFDKKFIVAITKLAGAQSTFNTMILSEGRNAYKLYHDHKNEVKTTLDVLCEYLEISTSIQFPDTHKAWKIAKTTQAIEDIKRRKESRKQLAEHYGIDAADLYDYSLLVSDYLWHVPMGYSDKVIESLKEEILNQSFKYSVNESIVQQFLSEATHENSIRILVEIVEHFNFVTWFVSYSHKEKEFVKKLLDFIETDQIRIWQDVKDIKPGDELKSSIQDGIAICDVFSVVLSKNSIGSDWVNWESKIAQHRIQVNGKPRIVPIVIEDVEIPTILSTYKTADFTDNFDDGLEGIISSLKNTPGLTI